MAVARGHRDGLMACEFLDLFDRCAGHCQPGAKGVSIRMPDVARNLRVFQAGLEPGSGFESALRSLAGKDQIGCLLPGRGGDSISCSNRNDSGLWERCSTVPWADVGLFAGAAETLRPRSPVRGQSSRIWPLRR
jgi:hypothetical protein